MANAPMGNNFWEGPLGVCSVTFNGTDLGKTIEDVTIEPTEDIKDIMYQQDGTQPADKVRTGQSYTIRCVFGQLTGARLEKILAGSDFHGNLLKLGRNLYQSGLDNEAKPLILTRVDSDGVASIDHKYRLKFYKAFPQMSGTINYGADTQKGLEISFYCFFDTSLLAFGFSGKNSSL